MDNLEKEIKDSKPKSTGNLKNINLDLKEPIPMKGNNIEFKDLSLFLGANGSGKSLMLITSWAISVIAQMIIATKSSISNNQLMAYAQMVFNNSFSNQNIDGNITLTFESNCQIDIEFSKGTIMKISYNGFEDLTIPIFPQYMSTNVRTFSQISLYLKLRLMLKDSDPSIKASEGKLIEKLLNTYKLYDVLYVETLIRKAPIQINSKIKETFEKFGIKGEFESICFDEQNCDFYFKSKSDPIKYLSSFSNGEQSLINMFLGSGT